MDPSAAAVTVLPDDVLAGVLRRLPPRSLAASLCVCKAWRAVVDEQQLLLRFRHLLPHSVSGIFINFIDHHRPHLFSRPTSSTPPAAGPRLNGEFSFVEREKPWVWYRVEDHCNGLVLRSADHFTGDNMFVINPATRRWAHLPQCGSDDWKRRAFIVFDPAVSPHYQVLLAPLEEQAVMQPSSWTWHVLSSTTMTWQERVFVREGAAPPAGLPPPRQHGSYDTKWRFAAYWQGALYVHCRGEFISRLSLSNDTYTVIESPIDLAACNAGVQSFVGKSRDGVYFATIDKKAHLRVWVLSETFSLDKRITKWLLKHHSALNTDTWWTATRIKGDPCRRTSPGPWIMDLYHDGWRNTDTDDDDEYKQQDWDSDDDYVLDIPNEEEEEDDDDKEDWNRGAGIEFLGFHPYKAVIFLGSGPTVAYHLDNGKIQYLGQTFINTYNRGFFESFVYTPCLIGD